MCIIKHFIYTLRQLNASVPRVHLLEPEKFVKDGHPKNV